jgi:hypothetical protein
MTDEKYNGWANYETWLVHLWVSNEEPTYIEARRIAHVEINEHAAGHAIEAWMDETFDLPTTGFVCDLVKGALGRVNWAEIGAAFRED